MKKILLGLVFILFCGYITNAQIKVVGDDYKDSLSGAKNYYDMDIVFDSLFPHLSPLEHRYEMEPTLWDNRFENMLGDTVFISDAISNAYKSTNGGQLFDHKETIPNGYYIIQGYVFGKENMAELGMKLYNRYSIHDLKKMILENELSNEGISYYLECVLLAPIDTIDKKDVVYAIKYNYYVWKNILCLRFYNEAKRFIGKRVYGFRYATSRYDDEWEMKTLGTLVHDDVREESLKLHDEEFNVKDVVFKDGRFFLILQGEKTGTFAKTIKKIKTKYRIDPNGKDLECPDIPCLCTYDEDFAPDNIGFVVGVSDYQLLKKCFDRQKQIDKSKKRQQELQRKQEQEKKKIDFRNSMISKYGVEQGSLVGNRQVRIGMTKEMCRDAWGSPINTYRTTTSYGQSEVWCYNYKTRVYFYNGKVVQIDD